MKIFQYYNAILIIFKVEAVLTIVEPIIITITNHCLFLIFIATACTDLPHSIFEGNLSINFSFP